jgi:hypothetical protein
MSEVTQTNGARAGFILLEAVVSLILLSMILTLFVSTLTFARRISNAGSARDGVLEISAGMNSISRWLMGALPARETEAGGEKHVRFDGDGSQLSFVTLGNGETQPGGMLAVTIAFTAPERSKPGAIVFASAPVKTGAIPKAPADEHQILVGNVMGVRFSYFGSPREEAPTTWYSEWRDASRLPAVVALRASIELNGRAEAIDFAFRIVSD